MIPTVVYLLDALRRALKKGGRGLSIVADSFDEALVKAREAGEKYPFADF